MKNFTFEFHPYHFLHYAISGQGHPLILLPGWGQSKTMWNNILKECASFATVYALDLPGFGASDNPPYPYNLSDYARVLALFTDKLHLTNMSIMAHSFAGKIALTYARLRQKNLDKIILIGSLLSASQWYALIPYYFFYYCNMFQIFYWVSTHLFHPKCYRNQTDISYYRSKIMLQTYLRIRSEDGSKIAPEIAKKLVLIHGAKDRIVPLQRSLDFVASLSCQPKMFILKNAGHFPHYDDKRVFLKKLLNFTS